jgi:hypothetical protein
MDYVFLQFQDILSFLNAWLDWLLLRRSLYFGRLVFKCSLQFHFVFQTKKHPGENRLFAHHKQAMLETLSLDSFSSGSQSSTSASLAATLHQVRIFTGEATITRRINRVAYASEKFRS